MAASTEQTQLERLIALRDAQEAALRSGVQARELAALSREYRATLTEIASLSPAAPKGDGIDEISKRRAARGAGSAKSRRNAAAD